MSVRDNLTRELAKLVGYSSNSTKTVALSAPDNIVFAIDFTAVDSMSCSLAELRVTVPSLVGARFDVLKRWAQALSGRITYLLENIGPLEFAQDQGRILIRSTPPDRQPDAAQFYEILLQSHNGGTFSLRRYRSQVGIPGRKAVDIQITHEVLQKLVADLIDTIPK